MTSLNGTEAEQGTNRPFWNKISYLPFIWVAAILAPQGSEIKPVDNV